MGKRAQQRLPAVLPVVVMGTDPEGRPLRQLAWTLDVSAGGARLVGVPAMKPGETISISHGDKKARFKVLWVGGRDTPLLGQMSVRVVDAEVWIWSVPPPKGQFRDAYRERRERHVSESQAEARHAQNLARRMAEVSEELEELESLAAAQRLDARVAGPFREAVRYMREACTAAQGWLEAEVAHRDPFTVLTPLSLARLRLAAALNHDLATELEGGDLPGTGEDIVAFSRSVQECGRRVASIVGG